MLQLRCLPEPLTPANGFSWSRQAQAELRRDPPQHLHRHHLMVGGDVGVLEDRRHFGTWLGATSLWRVLSGTPTL